MPEDVPFTKIVGTQPAWKPVEDPWSWFSPQTKLKAKTSTPQSPTVAAFRKGIRDIKDLDSLRYLADGILDHLDSDKKRLHAYREEIVQLRAENDALRAELNEPQEDI